MNQRLLFLETEHKKLNDFKEASDDESGGDDDVDLDDDDAAAES